jgi:hypothetical protein
MVSKTFGTKVILFIKTTQAEVKSFASDTLNYMFDMINLLVSRKINS